jgi:signal transduction histidine kinase
MEGIRSMVETSFRLVLHRSLARRMLLTQIIACFLAVAPLFTVLWQMSLHSARMDIDRNVKQMSYVLIYLQDPAQTAQQLLIALGAIASTTLRLPEPITDEIRYELRDAQGVLLAASKRSPASVPSGWRTHQLHDPRTGRTVVVAISELFIAQLWKREALRLMSHVALVTLVLVVPILLIGTLVLAHFGLTPLRELGRSIAARSPDNLAPINAARRYCELAPLHDELNRLLERLRETQAVERRFFADAAHELLTPIAALRTQTHLLATAPDEPAEAIACFDVEIGVQRVAATVRQLLMIARVSATDVRFDFKRQDLALLVQERLGAAASRALDKGIEIDLQAPQECLCVCDAGAIASVLDNVIDNAIRYVPPGGRIQVKLRRYRAAGWIVVADNGPGIAREYREKVFERFFRVPGNTETGSGLGLAIVARIVALHQGRVVLQDGLQSRGLTVGIRLPVLQRP